MRAERIVSALALIVLTAVLAVVLLLRFGGVSEPTETASAGVVSAPPTEAIAPPDNTESVTPPPSPDDEDDLNLPEVDIASWELRLVNAANPLPEDFIPELSALEGGQYFDSMAASALQSFVDAARAEGLTVYITSSYRSYATQKTLFDKKVSEYIASTGSRGAAEAKARTIVAYPGTSEHQSALAVDIVDKYYEYMNESLADTALSKWLKENCAEYGFILRFPEDKQDITGIMFEPWHFRYVGAQAAAYIMDNGLCLEEFIDLYN